MGRILDAVSGIDAIKMVSPEGLEPSTNGLWVQAKV